MAMPINFQDRLARSLALLKTKGIRPGWSPFHRLLRRLGLAVPPPLFAPPWVNAVILGVYFAVAMGILTWLLDGAHGGLSVPGRIFGYLVGGAIFGALMAWWLRRAARKHDLPAWDEA